MPAMAKGRTKVDSESCVFSTLADSEKYSSETRTPHHHTQHAVHDTETSKTQHTTAGNIAKTHAKRKEENKQKPHAAASTHSCSCAWIATIYARTECKSHISGESTSSCIQPYHWCAEQTAWSEVMASKRSRCAHGKASRHCTRLEEEKHTQNGMRLN